MTTNTSDKQLLCATLENFMLHINQHRESAQELNFCLESVSQPGNASSLRHERLATQNQALHTPHRAAPYYLTALTDLLAFVPTSPLLSEIDALLKKESFVQSILSAPPKTAEGGRASSAVQGGHTNRASALSSFTDWLQAFFVQELGKFHLSAEQQAFALSRARELEAAVAVLASTPELIDKFVVAVGGGFSSGKSSFISSLIQDETIVLPNGIEPVTAIPTYVMPGSRDVIRGHTFRGGEIVMPIELYEGLSHDFVQSLGFNLRDILPYATIETTLRHVEHLAFVDLPGYDAAASEGAYTAGDEHTATDFMQSADAVVWVVGLDSNGTLPDTDLTQLRELSERNLPVHVVLNKADLREPGQVTEVLEQIHTLLDGQQISFIGLSAYSAVLGEELQFLHQSLLKSLRLWDSPVQPLARVLRQFDELMDQLGWMVEGALSKRTAMLDAVQSLRLDFMELLTHLPSEASEDSDPDPELRSYIEHVYGADELDDLIGTQGGHGTRSSSLRRNVNKRMSQLQEGLLESVDPAAAEDLLLRMRRDGMNHLKRALA